MIISERSPLSSLARIMLLVVVLGWMFVGQVAGVVVGSLVYGDGFLAAMSDPANHPGLRTALLLSQGIGSALGLIFIPWFYLKTSEHRSIQGFYRNETQWPLVIAALFAGVITMAISISPVAEWNASFNFPEWMSGFGSWAKNTERLADEIIKSITTNLTPGAFILAFVVVAIIPAIGEEIVFRGLIQTELVRAVRNPHVAIWIASILFSAIHLQFMGFIPRVLIGAFLGYLYYWSGNLLVPMLGHFFNNGLQLTGIYLNQQGAISMDLESTDSAPLPMVAVSLVFTFGILFYLKKYFASRSTSAGGSI